LSVNHIAPSGPATMPVEYDRAPICGVGSNLLVPLVVIRPIAYWKLRAYHNAPSGPGAM